MVATSSRRVSVLILDIVPPPLAVTSLVRQRSPARTRIDGQPGVRDRRRERMIAELDSVDAKTLLHRVALVPDVDIVRCQLCRPLWRHLIHALDHHTIDVVVEDGPWVSAVCRVESLTRCGGLQCSR